MVAASDDFQKDIDTKFMCGAHYVILISRELSSHSITGASKSFGAGLSSIEGDLELSVPGCSASTVRLSRGLSERC